MHRIERVVTHPGQAHRDEVFAVGLLFSFLRKTLPIERRNPTAEELLDPTVAVVDIGGQHDPAINNFDHHQFPRGVVSCALWLVAQAVGLHELLSEYTQWYQFTGHLDSLGPTGAAKYLKSEKFPFEAMSPMEEDWLENFEKVPNAMASLPMHFMARQVEKAQKLKADFEEHLEKCTLVSLLGHQVLVGDFIPNPAAMSRVRRHHHKLGGPTIVASITRDDRGDGWCLYRYDDAKSVDFGKLAGNPKVTFTHAGGFIAKTLNMPLTEALELASGAWVK